MASVNSPVRVVLLGLFSLAIAMGIGRFLYTPLLPMMQADGLINITNGGVLASINFVGYWVGAVFADRVPGSPRSSLRWSLIAIGLSTLAMGLTENYIIWLILRFAAGVLSAFVLVLVSTHMVKLLAENGHGRLRGFVFSGVGFGIMIAGLGSLALMANMVSSASAWLWFGVVSLIGSVLISLFTREEVSDTPRKHQVMDGERTALDWAAVTAYFAVGVGYIIPATYLPVMAREIISSPLVFGWAWPVFGLAAFLSTIIASRLQHSFSPRSIWVTSQLIMALGLMLPVLHGHIALIFLAGLCVGGTMMVTTMMAVMEAHRIAVPSDVMRHVAVFTAAFASGQIIGPLLASYLHDWTGGFVPSLVTASIFLAITAIALARSRR